MARTSKRYIRPKTIKVIGQELPTPYTDINWTPIEGLVLIIDTREQQPFFKRPPKGLIITRDKLDQGDYSIKGFEHEISFERKSLSDLYTSLGTDRERFIRELERLRAVSHKFLLIESSEYQVLMPQEYSMIHPNAVRQALAAFEIKYGLHIYYGKRKDCERYILDRVRKFYLYKRRGEI